MTRDLRMTMDGRRFRWIEAGAEDAPKTMIWLHAFPLGADMWRPQLDHVAHDWRVVAPDLAGFGGTDDHDGPPSIDDFARDLDRLADQLEVERFVLGGLSMGGYATFAYLRLNAARVSAVVLADTKAGPDTPQAKEGRQKLLDLVAAKGVAGIADEMLPKLLGPTTKENDPGLVAHVRTLIEANRVAGIARATMRLRDRPDAFSELPGIAVPVLVLVGDEDAVTPPADAHAIAEALPQATLSIVPRAGHLSNLEAPGAFDAALTPWLSSL